MVEVDETRAGVSLSPMFLRETSLGPMGNACTFSGGPFYCPSFVGSTALSTTPKTEEAQGSLIHSSKKSRSCCVTTAHAQPGFGRVQQARASGGLANLVESLSWGNLKAVSGHLGAGPHGETGKSAGGTQDRRPEYQNPRVAERKMSMESTGR